MKKSILTILYVLFDIIAAITAWTLFYYYRKFYIETPKLGTYANTSFDTKFFISILSVTLFWLLLNSAMGYYKDVYRKSRLQDIGRTLLTALIGTLILFFALILDDYIISYKSYYKSFAILFGLQTSFTLFLRLILTSNTVNAIHAKKIGFNTLIVGSSEKAVNLFHEIENETISSGYKLLGFVDLHKGNGHLFKDKLKHLGCIEDIEVIINTHQIEEVIIAIESSEHQQLKGIIDKLETCNVTIKILPDMYDILTGSVKMTSIFGAPLIVVSQEIMPVWQFSLKRFIDITVSVVVLLVASPIYIITAIIVKITSKGSIFYSHERVGLQGTPFKIYKYRSMYVGSEKDGPALSSKTDKRITPFGKFMRKSRLDEIPQFYNVLKGDMSIVGPRPERQFFIDQIVQKAPHYKHLHRVRPGITSWGQVKYGYAENVDQMIERLKYDILYIENMSLAVDLKIMIYTVLIVIQGRGK